METGPLFLSLFIGAIGSGLFLYGKKQSRMPHLCAGLALVVYPYFVPNLWLMGGIALALLGGLWAACKAGY